MDRFLHVVQQPDAIVCKIIAGTVSASLMLTCAVPSAYARNNGNTTVVSDSGVTVISNGKVVTDSTIVSAAESLRTDTARNNVTPIDSFSDDSEPAFSTNTILGQQQDDTFASNGEQTGGDGDSTGVTDAGNAGADDAISNDSAGNNGTNAGQGDAVDSSDDSTTDSSDSNNAADSSDGDTQTHAVSTALGGRDFIGQVTKTINGKTYILIGNEQQLRAIGTKKSVLAGPVYSITQSCSASAACLADGLWKDKGSESLAYKGDADLDTGATLRGSDFPDHDSVHQTGAITYERTKYFFKDADGNRVDVTSTKDINTGLKYTATANYIIFRDIDLSSAKWSPLMFSGVMLGAVSAEGETASTLWDVFGEDGESVQDGTAKPTISHVKVNQPAGNLDVDKQQGIGFFASITSTSSITNSGNNAGGVQSTGTVVVANLKLSDVNVANNATVAHVDETLVSALLKLVSLLLPKDLGLNDLLTVHKNNPSNFATGAFAGRIYGDAKVTGCVVEDATVSNVKGMTGGFAGYVEGATKYDIASESLGALIEALTKILNVIPFLGLGDLVDWLLGSTLGLNALVPVGYYNPVISDSHVVNFKQDTTLGNADSDYAGGFVGAQIGSIIENSSVKTQNGFTVTARKYAGGFAGVSRNGEVGGLLNSLGITILSALRPQSLIENSTLTSDGEVSLTAQNYAGGFAGRLANAYAVNDTVKGVLAVTATVSHAGGFTGRASAGWGLEAGTDSDEKSADTSLIKQLTSILTKLLEANPDGAGALLTIAGVNPSIILGAQMNGDITVTSNGDYAGGIVGDGSGTVIGDSSQAHLENLSFWKYNNAREFPEQRSTLVGGLKSVKATGSYAGGIAGNLQPTQVVGLLNSVAKIGSLSTLKKFDQFAAFTVENVTFDSPKTGWSVEAGGYYAGGAIGCASGGDLTDVTISNLSSVAAKGESGGFIGFSGPADTVGASGLNLLGLIKLSGLLSVAEYSSVEVLRSNVSGIADGLTVTASGHNDNNEENDYAAGGFYGQANSTKTRESHVTNLKSVTADTSEADGLAGGFVGYSTTGGLMEAASNGAEDSSALKEMIDGGLLSVDNLLGAVPYLIPDYKDTTVTYVNGGYVKGDVAGGFAGNFQSGKVNQFSTKELEKDETLEAVKNRVTVDGNVTVNNLDHVTGGAYAGGFGGKVVSGALASAGKGGISLLGKLGTVKIADLVDLVQGYVPYISYAGVKSGKDGLRVTALRLDKDDSLSGSAGGYIGYGSGMQVAYSSVNKLRYTKVTEPKALEGTDGSSYFDDTQSKYAVDAKRYAGGWVGRMDIGSAASVGEGLSLLGGGVNLGNVLSVLNVVVSTVEHSDVIGDVSGYAVRASSTDAENESLGEGTPTLGSADNPIGDAGGFAGRITGGHVQDANAHNFAYIIGQITAGGYAGGIEPGDAASVLGSNTSVLNGLVDTSGTFASLLQDFVPTIRNSSTDAVPCGGAVRAQAASDGNAMRGMAGGYVGHNEGGHIWGKNNASWKSENDDNNHYNGEQRTAFAARIRSVYGAEFAGGFTGFMQAASTADTGGLKLLYGLIKVDNLLGALQVSYPTEENTQVTGPLRNLDATTWQAWIKAVGVNGAYGKEFAEIVKNGNSISSENDLADAIDNYAFGTNVVAGRTDYSQTANASEGGNAGGYVGLMRSGVIANGQAQDTRQVRAMKAAGGFAGTMQSGGAAELGGIDVLGLIKANLGKLASVLNVFVPVVKSSSVTGYRRGMTVTATGTDLTHETGYAGGYVGYAGGAQIWGDKTFSDAEQSDDRWSIGATHAGYTASGCNALNLRRVKGANAIGGYAGMITAAGVADVNTNASEGILQSLLDALIKTPQDLAQVVQATVSTVRGATVSSVKDNGSAEAWGFTVEGKYTVTDTASGETNDVAESDDDAADASDVSDAEGSADSTDSTDTDSKTSDVRYARAAGGFAGIMKAVIAGTEKNGGTDTANTLIVDGLRGVDGGQYAGGFVGQADTTAVASVAGGTDGDQSTKLLLGLVKAGNISALEAFRTFIHHAQVNGVADGFQVRAHDSSTQGILDSKRYTGAAGGFAGGLINGTVDYGTVNGLNSVSGVNYAGGFVGHLGKAGTVDVDNAQVSQLLGATAGVLDIWGSHVDDSSVAGIADGFTVAASHSGGDYQAGTEAANGREVAGGFTGYADLARVSRSKVTGLKKVSSGELAGGFVGETTMAYLVETKVSSVLVDIILKVVNALVKLLYVPNLEKLGVIDLGKWLPDGVTKLLNIKILADGDLLYVNLFGLKIGVSLSKKSDTNGQQTDVAIITIGDSTIKLPCTENGVDENQLRSELSVELIKANRTKATYSSVQGIADGYDVFGGGATQTTDGVEGLSTGIAGGFVGLNHEGLLEHDDMTYADTIRGTSGLVGPFSGKTELKSVYEFNSVQKIEGNGNTYHIYRNVPSTWSYALTKDNKQFTYGSHMDDVTDEQGNPIDVTGALRLRLNRYDVAHRASEKAVIKEFSDYKDAKMANNTGGKNDTGDDAVNKAAALGVYVSAAQAVLMLDTPTNGNNGGLTPEPDDGQDPCGEEGCQVVDMTLQKVWDDIPALQRPKSITIKVTATYTEDDGTVVTPKTIECKNENCEAKDKDNPFIVTMTSADGSLWSDTWRTKITGLPVAFKDGDTTRYYTYTVEETGVDFGKGDGDKDPAKAGYRVSYAYDNKEVVATVTNSRIVLPGTGGNGIAPIVLAAVLVLGLGAAWTVADGRRSRVRSRGRHLA
nr:Cna B-type domain-containing protein [Bifidobacterium callitrichidarum]